MANKVEELKSQKDALDVWPDLLRYSEQGYDAITPDDMLRMRWYGIYEQQPREGYFMMRVKLPGGDVSAAQWRVMGEIARDYGRGIADITTRQNIQYHWLTIVDIPAVIEKLGAVGLSTVGACGDITRNICGCPVAGIDPDELYDCREIIEATTRYFNGNAEYSNLPRKFKMTIAACPHHCHQPEINDVGITAVRRPDGSVGFHVRVGGGLSTQPHFSQQLDVLVTPEQVQDVCKAAAAIFRDSGYRDRRNHARMKFLVADWGAARFREELIARLGWTPEPALEGGRPVEVGAEHTGVHAQKQAGLNWVGVAVMGGRLSVEQMLAAADIADTFGSGTLRTTNQQNLLFVGIPDAKLDGALAAIGAAGFRWDVTPFRRTGVACTGTEFCNLALTETKGRLGVIVDHLEKSLVWDGSIRINVNGCPNSCGQHHIGDIGLQGCLARVGDDKVEAYDICLGGRLGPDARFTRPIQRKVPADQVHLAIERLLRAYQETRSAGEAFPNFVDRHSDEELGAMLGAG